MKKYIKELNRFAIPLIANFATGYFMEITDEAIIARVSTPAFTAVSLVNGFVHMVAGILGVITIYFNAKGAKEWGAENPQGLEEEWNASQLLSFLLGVAFLALMLGGRYFLLQKLYNLSGETLTQAEIFSLPMSLYVLMQVILFSYGTYFRIRNLTKWIFWGSTVASILDVGLDYLFVLGPFGLPRLGVAMVGWSTIFSLFVNLMIYVIVLKKKDMLAFLDFKKYLASATRHLKASLILIGQEIIEGILLVMGVQMIIIRLGDNQYTGYAIIMDLLRFIFVFRYIYGSAALSLVGTSLGAKDKEALGQYPNWAVLLSTLLYIGPAVIIYLFRNQASSIITNDPLPIEVAAGYMAFFILANSIGGISYIYRSSLQALSEYNYIFKVTTMANAFSLLIMLILTMTLPLGLIGVAIAQFVNELLTGYFYLTKYRKIIRWEINY